MKSEKIVITSLAYGGDGIGRCADGRVCFVPGVLPGEEVVVEITAGKKRFCRGKVVEIIKKSGARVIPECPLHEECPGCAYMHCSYDEELKWKHRQLSDFLLRNDLAESEAILPPVPSSEVLGYRNKITLHSSGGISGYYGRDNRTLFPVEKCLLAVEAINEKLKSASGNKAVFRFTEKDGVKLIDPENPGRLTEKIPGFGEFDVAGEGFFQVNLPVASELVKLAAEEITEGELLELYCGVGVFSVALAEKNPELHCTGIELSKKAIEFAKVNAKKHGVADRCRFYAGDAGRELKKFRKKGDFALLLDPPRSGVEKETLQKIIELGAGKIIYISCAADTLTRDLKGFISAGYRVKSSRVLDMFPRTAHFESFTVLEREK